jgi:hypothetical protein
MKNAKRKVKSDGAHCKLKIENCKLKIAKVQAAGKAPSTEY